MLGIVGLAGFVDSVRAKATEIGHSHSHKFGMSASFEKMD